MNIAQSGYFLPIAHDAPSERRYAGRTAEQRRADRRTRLLEAGLERFGTTGYGATTIEGLCAAASLNARYFYEQFPNREALLAAVYDLHVQRVLAAVRAALAAAEDPDTRLEAGLRAFVEAMLSDERGARVVYLETVGVSPTLETVRRAVRDEYIELIATEAARPPGIGAWPRVRRRAVAVALIGASDGLIIDWLAGDRRRVRSEIVDMLGLVFGPTLR